MVLLKKRNDTLDRVKKVEIKPSSKKVKINIGSLLHPNTVTIDVDLANVSYSHDNRHYLFHDIESGNAYTFSTIQASANPIDADTMNATGLVAAAMRMIGANYGLAVLIISAVAGLAFGFIIGQNIDAILAGFQ